MSLVLPPEFVSFMPLEAWKPFHKNEIPALLTPEMAFAAGSLSVCKDELIRLSGFYELYIALNSIPLDHASAKNPIHNSIANIKVGLLRNIIVIIPALYDNDPRSVNLYRIANTMLDRRSSASLNAFHKHIAGGKPRLDGLLNKLRVKQKLINGAVFKRKLAKLIDARNKLISHYDIETGVLHSDQNLNDISYVFLLTARVAVLCASIMTVRQYDLFWSKKSSAAQAQKLIEAIIKGSEQVAF